LAKLLRATITNDRYPLSPRLKPLKSALAKLNPAGPSERAVATAEAVDEQQQRKRRR